MKIIRNLILIIISFITSVSCIIGTAFLCAHITGNNLGLGLLSSVLNLDDGTYYLSRNGNIDNNIYFDLSNGKWEDENNFTGKYKISNGEITLYVGDGAVFASGTISKGKMELKISQYLTLTYIKR